MPRTAENFYGKLWTEIAQGTNVYQGTYWVPSVFDVTINPDTLGITVNFMVSQGTSLPVSPRQSDGRQYYIGEDSSGAGLKVDTHTGLGIYTYHSPMFVDPNGTGLVGWLSYYSYGWLATERIDTIRGVYVGAYYDNITMKTYLILGYYDDNAELHYQGFYNKVNTGGYNSWTSEKVELLDAWILRNFYGKGVLPEQYTIKRIQPESDIFTTGQASTLSYILVDSFDNTVSTDFSLVCEPSTGWGFNDETGTLTYYAGSYSARVKVSFLYEDFTYSINDVFRPLGYEPPYSPGGTSGTGGGGGLFGDGEISDDITALIPNGSTEENITAGSMFTRLIMSADGLGSVASLLWTNNWWESLGKEIFETLYGNILDSVIMLNAYPFALTSVVDASATTLKLLGSPATISGLAPSSAAGTFDWGTISIDEYWGNFLDYAPHTKIELYLPWGAGMVAIDPNEVMNTTIGVRTNIELDKGTCVHTVYNGNGVVLGTYSGVCARQLPITGRDTSGKAIAVATTAVSAIVAGAAMGGAKSAEMSGAIEYGKTHHMNFTTAMTRAMSEVPGYISPDEYKRGIELASQKSAAPYQAISKRAGILASGSALAALRTPPSLQRNGSFTSSGGSLGVQRPYVIITRPDQSVPDQYGSHYGYPSNIYSSLSLLSGYTEVGQIHLTGINATSQELIEIESLLKGGVIL